MPELPEVETIKNELAPYVTGKQITDVAVYWERTVQQPAVGEFRSQLTGQRVKELHRRGKFLIFRLDNGRSLLIHLRMSGSLLLKPSSEKPDKYVRAIIGLNGKALHFRDPRKFGKMWLVDDENYVVGNLGPEPLEKDFTASVLSNLLANRTAPVKALLCDQALISGIGNMYADEALFHAKIHPLRQGKSLSPDEIERLHQAIQFVLKRGIHNKGASVTNYFRPDGKTGTAHKEFQVAHRAGERCPVCGTPLERIRIRQRGSYFCPRCQPAA